MLHNAVEPYPDSGLHGTDGVAQELMALVLQPAAEADPLECSYLHCLPRCSIRHGVLPPHHHRLRRQAHWAQVLSMLALGDYVSYYLALLRGIDPSPTPSIEEAKGLFGKLQGL